jgi:predicted methyltransferase
MRSHVLENPSDDRTADNFAQGIRRHTDHFVLRTRKPLSLMLISTA